MSRKRLFGAFLIITSLIIMLLPAAKADAETSASAFTIKGGKLISYKGIDRTVSVPDTVTTIGKGAFEDNDNVHKIILPKSVERIEAYAFWGCDNLETVVLGKGLTTIDDFAFMNCDGLETMTIPSNIKSIGIQAFADCDSLEDITIPPQVTDISEDAFDGDYLLNIHCEAGSYADKYAKEFYERQKDMSVYVKPESESGKVEFPEDGVYSGADASKGDSQTSDGTDSETVGDVLGTTQVVDNQAVVLMQNAGLPVINGNEKPKSETGTDGATAQPDAASGNETGADGTVVVERAHYRDELLTEAVVADTTKEIGAFAYARSGLERISLPEGLTAIGYAAFYHCDNLTEVEIPDSVTLVEDKAFSHTPWVNRFLTEASAGEDAEGDFLISGGVLVAYRGDGAEVVIPEGVRVIAGGAFEDHTEIKSVILPSTLQALSGTAFEGCSPDTIDYKGKVMDDTVEELRVTLSSNQQAPDAGGGFPLKWVAAVLMLLSGGVLVLHKIK